MTSSVSSNSPAPNAGSYMLDASEAVSFLVGCGGDPRRAAVAASEALGVSVSEAQILVSIARDPSSIGMLSAQIRLMMVVQMADAFRLTHAAYLSKLSELSPRDTANAYSQLVRDITSLTAGVPMRAPDPFETLLKNVPPEVADAVRFFHDNPDAAKTLSSVTPEPLVEAPSVSQPSKGASPITQGVTDGEDEDTSSVITAVVRGE